MVHRSTRSSLSLATAALLAAACGGGGSVSNASPRLSEVPLQSVDGGTAFSLDLADYVSDREGATLTYTVTSGGGAFTGSVYSNMFDTMGTYAVEFSVSDGQKTTTGTFEVRVETANLVVVREDSSGVLLLDSATNAFVRVAGAASTPTFAAGLDDGRLVYSLAGPAGSRLWIFDPMTRQNTQLVPDATSAVSYRAQTSDGRIVYGVGSSNDSSLHLYNPRTGVTRDLAQSAALTVLVNDDDLVFFEARVDGQVDIYGYDAGEDEVFAVSTAATAEQLLAVLPNGGIVLSRIGAGGETDLFYYRAGNGLVEIAGNFNNIGGDNKSHQAAGTASEVVLTADSGSATEIYAWKPLNGQTYAISTLFGAGATNTVAGVAAGGEVVFSRDNGGGDVDAFFYDLDSAVSATLRNDADTSTVLGVTSGSTSGWAFIRPSGTPSSLLAVSLVGTPVTVTWAAGGAVADTLGILANGDVVARRADGTALAVFDVSAGTFGAPIVGTGLAFAGAGLEDGDFVYSTTVSSQTDLSMWDSSASGSVVISDTAGNDVFQALTDDGTILFTRVVGANTNADLFVWNGTTATRLTDTDSAGLRHDHTVLGKYAGSR